MSEQRELDMLSGLLDDFLELDRMRFEVRLSRARADAGPSLMGGPRGIEHWTYEYVRRQIDDCLREASMVLLEFCEQSAVSPQQTLPLARTRLSQHFQRIYERLRQDLSAPPAHEYDVRPAPQALRQIEEYGTRRLGEALAAVGRGRLDPRLAPRIGVFGQLVERAGGGQKLMLYAAIGLFALVMLSFF